MIRNAYQRGNRDGLTSLAKWLEAQARRTKAQGDKLEDRKHGAGWMYFARAAAFEEAAADARRQAESLPEDPGEDPDTERPQTASGSTPDALLRVPGVEDTFRRPGESDPAYRERRLKG